MQNDYNRMVQSVATNGGFYIGRYESSLISGTTRVLAGATSMNANDETSARWYGLYARQKKFAIDNGHNTLGSHMVWGSQYDAMMTLLTNNSIDVTWESPIPGAIINTTHITGAESKDKLNNIYDLLGNSFEWTAEAYKNAYRVYRGSVYESIYDGEYDETTPEWRYGEDTEFACELGSSRVALYI